MSYRLLTHNERTALASAKEKLEEQAAKIYPLSTEHYTYVEMVCCVEEISGMLGDQSANIEIRDADNRVDAALKRSAALLERAQVIGESGDFHAEPLVIDIPRSQHVWIENAS